MKRAGKLSNAGNPGWREGIMPESAQLHIHKKTVIGVLGRSGTAGILSLTILEFVEKC